MKVIIIGGIAAGMSAAAKFTRLSKESEVVVYEKHSYISFGACGLPYYVGGFFDEHERMLVRSPEQMKEKGIHVCVEHEVLKVDPDKKVVLVRNLKNMEVFEDSYDRLMIATGASATKPPIAGMDLRNVYGLRSLEDGFDVRTLLASEQVKRVGIIGAGFIGLEVADAVHHLGKEAILFQLPERVLPGVFDSEITDILEQEIRASGMTLYVNTRVQELQGLNGAVSEVITDQGSVAVDAVIIAAGVRPNTDFLKDTGIRCLENGAIIIDEEGKTSVKDIYAAGDCATVPHRLKSEPAYLPLATTANKLGRIVGTNLAGGKERFEGTLGSSCLKLLTLEAGRTGLSEEEAKAMGLDYRSIFITDKNHTDYYPDQEKLSIKLIYDAKTKVLLGGQLAGKSGAVLRTDVLAAAITAGMTTEQLGMLDLCYAPPFSRTWDALNVAGNVAR